MVFRATNTSLPKTVIPVTGRRAVTRCSDISLVSTVGFARNFDKFPFSSFTRTIFSLSPGCFDKHSGDVLKNEKIFVHHKIF